MNLVEHTCPECYIVFGMESGHDARLRKDHRTFYCPSGHSILYPGTTDAEKLKEERENKEWALKEMNRLQDEVDALTRKARKKAAPAKEAPAKKKAAKK